MRGNGVSASIAASYSGTNAQREVASALSAPAIMDRRRAQSRARRASGPTTSSENDIGITPWPTLRGQPFALKFNRRHCSRDTFDRDRGTLTVTVAPEPSKGRRPFSALRASVDDVLLQCDALCPPQRRSERIARLRHGASRCVGNCADYAPPRCARAAVLPFCCARTTPTVTALSRWRFEMVGGGMLARSAERLTCWRKFPRPLTTCGEARLKRRARPKCDGYPSISLAQPHGARYPPSTTSEVPVT